MANLGAVKRKLEAIPIAVGDLLPYLRNLCLLRGYNVMDITPNGHHPLKQQYSCCAVVVGHGGSRGAMVTAAGGTCRPLMAPMRPGSNSTHHPSNALLQ